MKCYLQCIYQHDTPGARWITLGILMKKILPNSDAALSTLGNSDTKSGNKSGCEPWGIQGILINVP